MLSEGQEILEKRFIVSKKLGSGAFGEIYKSKKRDNSKNFIKLLILYPRSTEEVIWKILCC